MKFPKLPLPSSVVPSPLPIPPETIPMIIDFIIKAGDKILDKVFAKDETKDQPAYNPEKSEAAEVANLNAALMDYRGEVKQATAELEEEIKKACENVFTEVLGSLEFANEEFEFYRPSRLKRKLDTFLQELDGIFANYTAKRISLDDTDCLAVLKMRPGDLKGQRMRELKERVFKESVEEVNRKLNSFVSEFFEDMDFSVDHRMSEVERRLEEKIAAFEIAENNDAQNSGRLEEIILRAEYLRSVVFASESVLN